MNRIVNHLTCIYVKKTEKCHSNSDNLKNVLEVNKLAVTTFITLATSIYMKKEITTNYFLYLVRT
uniref:Uncharacterized protein n=1 Tax=Lepeophtheirus salmonis TaxID=72036 RepID=A0A0K2VE19_LEPSM